MSEYASSHHELSGSERGIQKLREDFDRPDTTYFGMFMALREYADDYLDFRGVESANFLIGLEKSGRLPTLRHYQTDPIAAHEMSRLAIYTTWMPLFQLSHSTEEYAHWLPHALQIIAPNSGRHKMEVCVPQWTGSIQEGEACHASGHCPLRHILYDVYRLATDASLDTLDYTIDAQKAYYDTQVLIDGIHKHGLVGPGERNALQIAYRSHFEDVFPPPEAPTGTI